MRDRPIGANHLKQHYSWWGTEDKYKQIFDQIIDAQPTMTKEDMETGMTVGDFKGFVGRFDIDRDTMILMDDGSNISVKLDEKRHALIISADDEDGK